MASSFPTMRPSVAAFWKVTTPALITAIMAGSASWALSSYRLDRVEGDLAELKSEDARLRVTFGGPLFDLQKATDECRYSARTNERDLAQCIQRLERLQEDLRALERRLPRRTN